MPNHANDAGGAGIGTDGSLKSADRRSNRYVFSHLEFGKWTNPATAQAGFAVDEAILVSRFFRPDGVTLEAGTGSGRVAFALVKAGFSRVHAIDYIPAYVDLARQRDLGHTVEFAVMDAADLDYADATFDQAIYAAGMINAIEGNAQRQRVLREAHRVLRPGGVVIISADAFEIRLQSKLHRAFMTYLAAYRWLRRSHRPPEEQPWMRLAGRLNWRALRDDPPYIYWYRLHRLGADLEEAGFRIEAAATSAQLAQGTVSATFDALARQRLAGTLYAVARKPA